MGGWGFGVGEGGGGLFGLQGSGFIPSGLVTKR